MTKALKTIPTTFVIFGATGDLFRQKLSLALLNLFSGGALPEFFRVVAFSRRPWKDEEFRNFVRETLAGKIAHVPSDIFEQFLKNILYVEGDLGNLESYQKLVELLGRLDGEIGVCMNKLFYLATPPAHYEMILESISTSGLAIPCAPTKKGGETGWTRILIEKPFGSDLENAQALDKKLATLFSESQIFRIDHYLAKETLQHILKFRFIEGLLESFWNREYIDRVEVLLFEKGVVGARGAFYDAIGALRDVGQNHALQMAALVAMERPSQFNAEAIRGSRAEAIAAFSSDEKAAPDSFLRGQYEGYLSEVGVRPNSETETYFKVELTSTGGRFRGVPFILESGKGLPESKGEIGVYFKNFVEASVNGENIRVQVVKFKISPKEEIALVSDSEQEFLVTTYNASENGRKNDAYEKVLLDAIKGDQTLFTLTEEVLAEWRIVHEIFKKWEKIPLVKYEKGTMPVTSG